MQLKIPGHKKQIHNNDTDDMVTKIFVDYLDKVIEDNSEENNDYDFC